MFSLSQKTETKRGPGTALCSEESSAVAELELPLFLGLAKDLPFLEQPLLEVIFLHT